MDGTERDVDANSNITLRVEVTAPTPNYTLEWACRLAADPDSGCFTDPDPWDTFTATRRVADRLVVRLWHIWDILHDDDGDGSRGLHPSSVTTTTYADEDTNTLRYKASPSENTLPRAAAARAWTASPLWKRAHTAKIPLSKRSSVKYIETISFPASSLLRGEDKFIVSVSCRYHLMASSDQQLIVIQSPRDSVGILSHLGTQFPFGAARRIVFESECMSCSPQELSSLSYSWHLKMIYEGPELEATTRAREGKEDSKDMALLEAIRQGRSGKGFLPRPRDYLRAYNATFAQAPLYQSVQREEDEDSLLSYTQYFNARDLQKLEGLVTPDMAARALEMESRWKEARQSSHKREKGQTGTHTFGRLKRSVQSPSLQRGWGRSGEKNTGGSGRASPSTHHPGDAQHHQMKDYHRTSSTQTNKRRGVVGRQLSLWTRGEDRAHDTTSLDPLPITSAEVVPRNDWEARKEEVPDSSWNAIKGTSAMAHRNMERKDSRKLQQVEAGSLPPPLYPHAERVNSGNSGRKFQTQEGMFSARQNVADKDTRLAYADGGGRGRSRSNERLEQLQAAGKVQDILQLHSHEMIPHGGRANDFERKELHKEEKDVERVSGGNRGEMLRQMNEGNHGGRDDQPGGGSEKRKKWRQMIVSGGGRGEAQARVTTEDPDEGVSFASTLSNSQVTERGDSGPDKESREDLRRAGVTQVTVEVGGGSPGNAVTPLNPPSEQPANARLIHQSGGEDAERAGGTTSAPWSTDAAAGAPHSSPSRPPKLPPSLARPTPFPPSDTSPAITPSLQVDKEQEERLSPASDDHSAREDEWSGLSALHQSRLEPEQEKEDTEQSEKIILVTEDKPVLMKSQGRKRWINRRGKKDKGRMERPKLEATPNKKKLEERDKEQQTENRWPVTTLSHEEEEAGYKENHLTFGADVNGGEKEAVEESDTEEEKSGVGAGRLGRINRQSTHQRHDSAHMPIRVAPSKGAPIRLSDQFVHGGVKGAAGATERKASMQRVLTVLLPDQSGVFDYKKYKKDNAAQLSRRQTSPNSSSESDLKGGRNVEDRLKQAASSKGRPRSGGDEISSNLTTGDGIAVSHIPEDAGARAGLPSRRLAGEREDQFTQRQKGSVNNDADKEKQESRGWWNAARGAGGEVGRSPLSSISTSRPRPLTSVEGRVESIRGVGYHKAVRDYGEYSRSFV
nr:uncharacterized protein LOC123751503 [Procambarus clarkii]XP_045589543.1 uncharacterized protein LOC123751503 [Procambarus clarkii]